MMVVGTEELTLRKPSERMRESNFELLRILSMVLIVAAHWGHGFTGIPYQDFSVPNLCIYHVVRGFGQIGVVIYILISGYFLCKSTFKIQTFLRTALQVMFYCFIIMIVDMIVFPEDQWSVKRIISYLLLLGHGDFWFVGPYIVMFLLSPFINFIITRLQKSGFLLLIVIMGVIVSLLPSITGNQIPGNYLKDNIAFFILIYLIGAFFRFYPEEIKNKRFIQWGCVAYTILYVMFMIVPSVSGKQYFLCGYFQNRGNYLNVLLASLIFLRFRDMRIKQSKVINTISASTFGIYLLHESFLMRQRFWSGLLHADDYIRSEWIFILLHAVISISLVFAVCSLIDIARKRFLEKPLFDLINKKLDGVFKKINRLLSFKPSDPISDCGIRNLSSHAAYLAMAVPLSVLLPYDRFLTFLSLTLIYFTILLFVWNVQKAVKGKRIFLVRE